MEFFRKPTNAQNESGEAGVAEENMSDSVKFDNVNVIEGKLDLESRELDKFVERNGEYAHVTVINPATSLFNTFSVKLEQDNGRWRLKIEKLGYLQKNGKVVVVLSPNPAVKRE